MRDLKADLELCNGFAEMLGEETLEDAITKAMGQSFSEFKKDTFATHALTGWPHAIERAMRAETLVRELVGVIDDLRRQINECGLDNEMWEVYERAKEVLGDE